MADEYKDVWVYIEHKDGATTPMSYELLGAGKMLADTLGSKVCAFAIGESTEEIAKEAGFYGAATVYTIDGAPFKTFRPDAFAKAACSLVRSSTQTSCCTGRPPRGRTSRRRRRPGWRWAWGQMPSTWKSTPAARR